MLSRGSEKASDANPFSINVVDVGVADCVRVSTRVANRDETLIPPTEVQTVSVRDDGVSQYAVISKSTKERERIEAATHEDANDVPAGCRFDETVTEDMLCIETISDANGKTRTQICFVQLVATVSGTKQQRNESRWAPGVNVGSANAARPLCTDTLVDMMAVGDARSEMLQVIALSENSAA